MLLNPKKLPAEPEVDPNGCCVSMATDALKAPECVCVSVGECEGCGVGLPAYPQRPDWERFSGAGMSGGSQRQEAAVLIVRPAKSDGCVATASVFVNQITFVAK